MAVTALIALSGCGRRGDLEAPSANAVQTPQNKHSVTFNRPDHTIARPDRDFVLDPLLK